MGFWGWRPLMICLFISVWVAGCNIVTESAPSQAPTPSPRVTLTVRRIAPPTAPASPSAVTRATSIRPSLAPTSAQNSPTPVVYVIQSGDTFGDLALKFGVDLDALKAANSSLDPRALQPGQTVIIPAAPSGSPTPTATPPALSLAPPACYETAVERVLCMGAVENTLDHPIEQVKLRVQIVGADGSIIADQAVDVEQSMIPAGRFAPYRAAFDADIDEVSEATAQLERADTAYSADQRYAQVEVQDQTTDSENGRYVITARLHNAGQEPADAIRLIATVRDSASRVIGYRVTTIPDRLDAGKDVPVRVEIVPQAIDAEPTVTLYVEARRGEPSSSPISTPAE